MRCENQCSMRAVIRYISKQGTIMHEVIGHQCINCGQFIEKGALHEPERTIQSVGSTAESKD
jgi:hypothetical protein